MTIGPAESGPPILLPDDPSIVARGAELYAENCAACHGVDLEGQPDWRVRGPDGLLPAPPHDETGHTWHHDEDTLFRLTKYGVGEMIGDPDYASAMPAFEDVLTDAEIAAVLSYIKSTWPADIRARHDAMAR
nr:cytochrome c [Roseivivax sediminis]